MEKSKCKQLLHNYIQEVPEEWYQSKLPCYLETLDAISRTSRCDVFIADYHLWEVYHSHKMGHLFQDVFVKNVIGFNSNLDVNSSLNESSRIDKLNAVFLEFLETVTTEKRCLYSLRYNTKFDKKRYIRIDLSPIKLTECGKVWLMMCTVSLSVYSYVKEPEIHFSESSEYLQLNPSNWSWTPRAEILLEEAEKQILYYSRVGYSVQDIASKLYMSVDSIKARKKRLFVKLNVRNIAEATNLAIARGLL